MGAPLGNRNAVGPKPNSGRRPGFHHNESTREKIKVIGIISRLQRHVDGEIELSATQIRAAEILLRKVLPDLTHVDHSGDTERQYVLAAPSGVKDISEWLEKYKDLQEPSGTVN